MTSSQKKNKLDEVVEENTITDDIGTDKENLKLLIDIINGVDSNEEIPYRNRIISACKNNQNWNAEFSDSILDSAVDQNILRTNIYRTKITYHFPIIALMVSQPKFYK